MNNAAAFDQLDNAITLLLAEPGTMLPKFDWNIGGLVAVAAELRFLPRPEFKTRLKADLLAQAAAAPMPGNGHAGALRTAEERKDMRPIPILPTLFGAGYGNYPVQRASFAASLLVHAAAMTLLLSSAVWMVERRTQAKQEAVTVLVEPSPFALPASSRASGGGGGGGDHDKLAASKGALPRATASQLTPPAIVVRNTQAKLVVEPTVVAPPALNLSPGPQVGDPLSSLVVPSNGPGFGGGIGSGEGGGVGSGAGPGVGPGRGGGIGGGVYRVGGGVSAPRPIYDPDPDYSEEARKAKYQGTVILWSVIGPDGRPHDIKVQRSLGMGLDQKAIEAVRKWRFEPARKNGQPVAVQVNIEVNFRLY